MRSRNTEFSIISGDISKLVIGDVILPRSNHSSSAARSYEKPSVDLQIRKCSMFEWIEKVVPSAITGCFIISCVMGQIKSNGISVWLDARLNSIDRTPAKWLSTVNEFVRSHTNKVRSFEPDTKTVESILTAMQFTYRECSANVLIQLPCRSHTLIVLSMLHDNNSVPVMLNLLMRIFGINVCSVGLETSLEMHLLDTSDRASMGSNRQHTFGVHCWRASDYSIPTEMLLFRMRENSFRFTCSMQTQLHTCGAFGTNLDDPVSFQSRNA